MISKDWTESTTAVVAEWTESLQATVACKVEVEDLRRRLNSSECALMNALEKENKLWKKMQDLHVILDPQHREHQEDPR